MEEDLVSVIIPTYKRAEFLRRAILSVINQSYKPIEIIIVDDNDCNSQYRRDTEKIMEEFVHYKNIVYIKHKKNLNGSAARNTGIRVSKGKYIAFLDDDDEFLENKIEMQVRVLSKLSEEYGAVYGGYNIIRGGKIIKSVIPNKNGKLTSDLLQMNWGTGSGSNVLFRRVVFEKIGLYDESLSRHQDWDILLRMFRYYNIYSIDEVLLNIYKDSRINIPDPDNFVLVKKKFLSKFERDINELSIKEKNNIYKLHFLEITTAFIKAKKFKCALKYYKKARKYSRIELREYLFLILTLILFHLPKREKILIYFGKIIEKMRIIKS